MLVAAKVDRKALSHSAYCREGWKLATHLQSLLTATEGDYHNTSITPTFHLPLLPKDKDNLASSQTEKDSVSQPECAPLRYRRHSIYLYFIQPRRCNLYSVLYYYQRSTCFGRFFRPSSGAYKTVCAALSIVMLSCCWNVRSNPSTPAVDSKKA